MKAAQRWFTPRETTDGAPTSFLVNEEAMTVLRGGAGQDIPTGDGLGAVALCRLDGRVLGYGTLSVEEIAELAFELDGRQPAGDPPLARLATLGLALVLPLDAMPPEVRDAFLSETVDPTLVDAARITDEAISEAMAEHARHDHDHDEDCDTCAVREVSARIDELVATLGHAVVVAPESDGQVSYTVGLSDVGWPELAMSGIPTRAIEILNAVVSRLRAMDRRPAAGMTIDKAMSVRLKLRSAEGDRVGGAARARAAARGMPGPTFLQVTWPDADGYHPHETGYDDINLPQRPALARRGRVDAGSVGAGKKERYMTATVTRLAPPGVNVDIASHLHGNMHRQTGMLERMMGQEAVRLFVRAIASRHPLSDASGGRDTWAQVEDVCAAVTTLTGSTVELENFVHAVRRVISASQRDQLASSEGDLVAGRVRISSTRTRLRIAIDNGEGRRLMDFRLEPDGAMRIGNRMAGS